MTYPGSPLNALDAGGAFEIGGGDFTFGQDYTESIIKSLFHIPTPTLSNAIDLLQEYLLKLPIEALRAFKDLIPGTIDDDFIDVLTAVNKIIDSLQESPAFLALNEFTTWVAETFGPVATKLFELLQIVGGAIITPSFDDIVAFKDWFISLPGTLADIVQAIVEKLFSGLGITGHGLDLAGLEAGLAEWLGDIPIIGDIVDAFTGGSGGVLDDIKVWVQNLLGGDWLSGFVKALTGNNSIGHWLSDIEDWAGGVFHVSSPHAPKILPENITGLKEFMSVVPVGNIGKPTTSKNLLSNPAFTLPILDDGDFKWQGPKVFVFTVSGTFEGSTAGHSAQVGRGVDSDLLEWVPVSYSASITPMSSSISDGITKLKAAISATPAGSKIILVGTSQGAIVTSKVWEDHILDAGGDLHSRESDVVAAVAFGNPRRKAGSYAAGTSDPGGTGSISDDLMAATPAWWYDYTNPDDIVGSVPSGAIGTWAALAADFITNDWTDLGSDLLAVVEGLFGNPFGVASGLLNAVNQLGGAAWDTLTGHNPHTSYNSVKIDGTSTSVQLAIEYLDGIGATYAPVEDTDYEDHSDVGSGSIVTTADGTLKEYLHPDLIAVSDEQTVNLSAWVKTASFTATGTPLKLSVVTYDGDSVVSTVDLDSKASAASWTELAGSYDIPDGAGVDGVRLRVSVGTTATAGTVKVDDVSLTKTGLIQQGHVNGLPTALTDLGTNIYDTIEAGVTGLTGALGDGISWLVGDLFDASNAVRASLAQIAAAITALQQSASPEAGGGLAYVLDYTALDDGSLPANHSISYSGSGTRTLEISDGAVVIDGGGNKNTRRADVIINDQVTLTNTQKVSIVLGSTSNYFNGGFPAYGHWEGYDYIYGRSDVTGDNRIWAAIGDGAVYLGYRVGGGSDVQWATASHAAQAGAIYSLECGTSGGSRVFRVLRNGTAILTHSEVGTTSMLGASYRYGGYALRVEGDNSYNFASAGAVSAFALQDNVLPTYLGSGFRVYRASTTGVALAAGVSSSLMDTVDYVTNDLTWDHGANEVQTITLTGSPTGGTFRLTLPAGISGTSVTTAIAYNASAATVQSTCNTAMGAYGSCTVTGSNGGPWTIEFTGITANKSLALIVLNTNSLSGGSSPSVARAQVTDGYPGLMTVSRTGWYMASVSHRASSTTSFHCSIWKNGSLVKYGSAPSAQSNLATFMIYLNAGDYVQPGVTAATILGDAAGVYTYFELTKID